MKCSQLLMAVTLCIIGVGCSSIERSRNLSNPAVRGPVMAEQVCSICHGVDGNPVSPAFPRLAGQQAIYLTNQLKNFRTHTRLDPAGSEYMWGLSHHLTDDQIAGIADYYSKQTARRPNVASANARLLADGKGIFEKGVPEQDVIACVSCHGPSAQGIQAFPRLAYQSANYIVRQLNIFQHTNGRPGTPMEFISHPLTGANKDAVAAYLQAFPD